VLASLSQFAEAAGLSKNSFNMIYEGFWDLYCRKPGTADLTAKKLENFTNLINLKVGAVSQAVDEEEGAAAALPAPKAIVRVRVPFKRPEPVEGEEEAEESKSKHDTQRKEEAPLEEIEYEDKVLAVNTQGAQYQICVVHQLA